MAEAGAPEGFSVRAAILVARQTSGRDHLAGLCDPRLSSLTNPHWPMVRTLGAISKSRPGAFEVHFHPSTTKSRPNPPQTRPGNDVLICPERLFARSAITAAEIGRFAASFVVNALPDAGAPTMKELLDTDRVNFLVWRFVVFHLAP